MKPKRDKAYETERMDTGMDHVGQTLAAPGLLAAFARFVLCGDGVGWLPANAALRLSGHRRLPC